VRKYLRGLRNLRSRAA